MCRGIGNFVVKTKDPFTTWSDPVILPKVGGIDPSLFFDDDGKAYIVHNDAPEGTPEYDGHRAIWIHEYDLTMDQTSGTSKVLIDGGVDKSTKPVWIEGPHLYKIDGKYYLMAAEGGTGTNHSEVIFISDHVKGPYKPVKDNPILTQKDLPELRDNKVTSTGHADLIQNAEGNWFAVFLGCRPYKENMYNTGRETFLLPVEWKDNTPVILKKGKAVAPIVSLTNGHTLQTSKAPEPLTGNYNTKIEFTNKELDQRLIFVRTPRSEWWNISDNKLHITPTHVSIYKVDNPAFIGHRQQHMNFIVKSKMEFTPQKENEFAGLVCYQNERYNISFGKTMHNGVESLIVIRTANGMNEVMNTYSLVESQKGKPIELSISGRGDIYNFGYSIDNGETVLLSTNVDATILSTQVAGGFTGVVIGMYASEQHSKK